MPVLAVYAAYYLVLEPVAAVRQYLTSVVSDINHACLDTVYASFILNAPYY